MRKRSSKTYRNQQEVPFHPLLVFDGSIEGVDCRILKDDGASTNIISKSFYARNKDKFCTIESRVSLAHSSESTEEADCEMVEMVTLKIGGHAYQSRFLLANTRYDVILGTPWHKDVMPRACYDEQKVVIGDQVLNGMKYDGSENNVSNISIKKFRRLMKEKGTQVYAVVLNALESTEYSFGRSPTDPELQNIVKEYSDVFRSELPKGLPPKRSIDHEIITDKDAKIPNRRLFRLSPDELRATREYIKDNLESGRIRLSRSPYGAPLFFAKQKGKPLRGVVDYRLLNKITKKNSTPTPRADEMFDIISGSQFFTKIDLKTGFHQIRVKPEHIEKTAFQTKYGQYEYLVLPMGLCNAPATFTMMMNQVLAGFVDRFCTVYLDDILIFSKTASEHRKHVRQVLERLREHKLYASPKKCYFMTQEVEFLGIIVSNKGIQVNSDKISIIKEWPKPESISEVRGFLGLASFFRRFIKGFSDIALPLTSLTKKGNSIQNWDESCAKAMDELKLRLTSSPILSHPDFKKPFKCHVDASQFAVGGTLTQVVDGQEKAIAYFSRKLNKAQMNYSANDRELLGMIEFLTHFRCYLEGSTFEIVTDNQVLKYFFEKKDLSRREVRWSEILADFGVFPITLQKGSVHVLGDSLSRVGHGTQHVEVQNITTIIADLSEQEKFQEDLRSDQFFGPVISKIEHGESEARYIYRNGVLRLATGELCIPRSFVKVVLQMAHDSPASGHYAEVKTMARLSNYYWRRKSKDVYKYVKGCFKCQEERYYNKKPITAPAVLEAPSRRWGSISMDFIHGLPESKKGHDMILTFVDRFSKRPHFVPCKSDLTAIEVAELFYKTVFKYHGLPDSIVSDRDPLFTSNFWQELMKILEVRLKMSTAHHPQTDGQTEVMNRIVEEYLRLYCNFRQDDWDDHLDTAEFAYSSSIFQATGLTPFHMDLGWTPKTPMDLLDSTQSVNVQSVEDLQLTLREIFKDVTASYASVREQQRSRIQSKFTEPNYKEGDLVMIRTSSFRDHFSRARPSEKLRSKWIGPFKIIKLVGKNAVRLELPTTMRIHPVVNVSHTKPYFDQPEDLSSTIERPPPPVIGPLGPAYEIDRVIQHRRRGRGYQFLVDWKGYPTYEASWEPTSHFIDEDGDPHPILLAYIHDQDLEDEVVFPVRRE